MIFKNFFLRKDFKFLDKNGNEKKLVNGDLYFINSMCFSFKFPFITYKYVLYEYKNGKWVKKHSV